MGTVWKPCEKRVEVVYLQRIPSETVGQGKAFLNMLQRILLQRIFFNGGFRRLAICGHGFWDTSHTVSKGFSAARDRFCLGLNDT